MAEPGASQVRYLDVGNSQGGEPQRGVEVHSNLDADALGRWARRLGGAPLQGLHEGGNFHWWQNPDAHHEDVARALGLPDAPRGNRILLFHHQEADRVGLDRVYRPGPEVADWARRNGFATYALGPPAHYAAPAGARGPSVTGKSKGATAKAARPGADAQAQPEPLPPVRQLRGRLAAGGLAPLLAAHDWQGARAGHHEAVLNHLKALPAGGFLDALHGLADAAASGHPHARGWAQWAAENRPAGPEVGKAEFGHRASVVDTSKLPEDEQDQARGVLNTLPRLAGTGHPVAPAGFNYAGLLGEGVTSRPAGKGDLAMSHALASRPVHEQIAAFLPSPEQVSAAATAKGQAAALDTNLQKVAHLALGGERAGWEYAAGKGPADLRHAGMMHQSGQTVKPELDVKHLRGTGGRVKGAQENVRNKLAEATEDPQRLKASLAFNLSEDAPEEKRGAFLKFGVGGFTPGGKGSTQLLTHAEVQRLGTKEGAKLLRNRLESAFSRADLEGYGAELEKQKARMRKADARNISKTLHAQTGDLAANFEAMFGDKPTPAMLKRLGEMRHYALDTPTGLAVAPPPGGPALHPEGQAALAKFKGHLDAHAHKLSPGQPEHYHAAAGAVIGRMTPKAAARYAAHTRSHEFHANTTILTRELAKESATVKGLHDQGEEVGGAYLNRAGRLVLDGGYTLEGRLMPTAGVYAHEMGHAIDGPGGFRISDKAEWQRAWESELKSGKISEYAGTSPAEGFAEFSRLIHSTRLTPEQVAKKYPLSAAVWRDEGLL